MEKGTVWARQDLGESWHWGVCQQEVNHSQAGIPERKAWVHAGASSPTSNGGRELLDFYSSTEKVPVR